MSTGTAREFKYSPEFPCGYGDIELISRDGVTFSFPRFLLSHVSSVFKDMFSIGTSSDLSPQIALTEDSVTLDCLLRVLDLTKTKPPINFKLMSSIFQAADKYQVPQVFEWWDKEVLLSTFKLHPQPLQNPSECLALASKYGLKNTASIALRDLTKLPVSKLQLDNMAIESLYFLSLLKLRTDRACWFTKQLFELQISCTSQLCCPNFQKHFLTSVSMAIPSLIQEPSLARLQRHNFPKWRRDHVTDPDCKFHIRFQSLSASFIEEARRVEAHLPQI